MITATERSAPTPSGNTGSNRQPPRASGNKSDGVSQMTEKSDILEAHLDYLVLCGTVSSVDCLESACWAAYGVRFPWSEARPGTRGRFYESNVVSPTGVTLSTTPNTRVGGIDYRLSVPGKVLTSVTEQQTRDFGRYFLSIDARCTRFDWAIDDYSYQLDINTIVSHCESGRVSGFKRSKLIRSWNVGQEKRGDCLYLGSVQSDSILRIYDKGYESGGEIKSMRVELQTRDAVAHGYFTDYFSTPQIGDLCRRMSMRAISRYRFVEDVSEVLSRCPDVPWWADFVARVGGQIKVSVRRLPPMISDKKRWIEKQVCGTLSLIFKCMGVQRGAEWLLEQIQEKSREKEEYNQVYYDNWKERRKCDTQSYDYRVSRFIEEREYECVYRRVQQACSETIAAAPSVLFSYRLAVCMAGILSTRLLGQLHVFPEVHQLLLF